jgi:hypothetical protein
MIEPLVDIMLGFNGEAGGHDDCGIGGDFVEESGAKNDFTQGVVLWRALGDFLSGEFNDRFIVDLDLDIELANSQN